MKRDVVNILRLAKVSFILARCDALFLLKELGVAPALRNLLLPLTIFSDAKLRPGEKIVKAFYKLGPTFIKFGQILSTRSDIFGEEITADLAVLQDKIPPFKTLEAKKIIELELQRKLEDLFSEFSEEPIAAASIAQVHKAKDKNGKEVAVKILRPGIENAFAKNIDFLFWLAEISAKRIPKRLKPVEIVQTIAESVYRELDLRIEAAAASEMQENFAGVKGIRIPDIDWSKTSKKVLVLDWVDGIRIDDRDALLKSGHDIEAILKTAAEAMFKQVLVDGFFHADMHPGNIFINKNGEVVVVDFGIMGRLSIKMQLFLATVLHGFMTRDYYKAAKAHFDAGIVPKGKSVEEFAAACRAIGEPIIGLPQNEISVGRLLGQLFKVAEDFEMEVQPQLLLMQKTMMTTEGVGRKLNQSVNMWKLAEPLIIKWAKDNMGKKLFIESAITDIKEFGFSLKELINNINEIAKSGVKLSPETLKLMKKKGGIKLRHILVISIISSFITLATLLGISILLINYGGY